MELEKGEVMKYTKEDIQQIFDYYPVVEVNFTKVNGEARKMFCTLALHLMPEEMISKDKSTVVENPDLMVVWDLEKNAFRSFRIDSLDEEIFTDEKRVIRILTP